jgi:hypothetical protein
METKWTPGPYAVNRAPGHPTDAGITGPGDKWLGVCPKEQSDLFAAAPDLYHALAALLAPLGPGGYVPGAGKPATDRARAALAKARGETP